MAGHTPLSKSILESRYQKGDSFFHKLSPGWKILTVLGLLVWIALADLTVLVGLTILVVLCAISAGIPLATLLKLLRSLRWLLLVIGVFPMLFTPGTVIPVLSFLQVPITWEGIHGGTMACVKLTVMFVLSILLTRTTPPMALIECLQRWVILPSPVWRQKILDVFTVGLWSIQLIPILCVEAERFILGEMERRREANAETQKKMGLRDAWSAALLLGPLVTHLFGQVDRFALELQQEGDTVPEQGVA
ncbi:membrane hypothetical protein [Nitrospina gracilis 3/211]|uniref:Energy-coupling factor transporter transmembrane protein EcfT n=1 Tax=Nitrospina gracilis (strain 3/211) TaxID=1266370 RepID=M1YLH4_NITG3|nr:MULTISPECIES: energy-coupling factor transporter transmembrane component T [Nitrospina]MCF8724191.1 energy-coupling factor transport system permease protein [Nitrospina sp. Nb-3]CCQ91337.1 membrane hypothetical protein [Nitrospina gracilis 3/211]